jgi:hypothetical protein
VLAKLMTLLTWALTLILTIDFLTRLGFILGITMGVVALGVQAVLLAMMVVRISVSAFGMCAIPKRKDMGRGLITMAMVAGTVLWTCYTFAGAGQLPALLTGWWFMIWAYLSLVALPISPIVLVPARGSLAMRWRLLVVLLAFAGAACAVGWTIMIS